MFPERAKAMVVEGDVELFRTLLGLLDVFDGFFPVVTPRIMTEGGAMARL